MKRRPKGRALYFPKAQRSFRYHKFIDGWPAFNFHFPDIKNQKLLFWCNSLREIMYCFIFFLLSSLCIIGVFTEAMNCFSPPAKAMLPGVKMYRGSYFSPSMHGVQDRGAWKAPEPLVTGWVTYPKLVSCSQHPLYALAFKVSGSGYPPDTVSMVDRERWIQRAPSHLQTNLSMWSKVSEAVGYQMPSFAWPSLHTEHVCKGHKAPSLIMV